MLMIRVYQKMCLIDYESHRRVMVYLHFLNGMGSHSNLRTSFPSTSRQVHSHMFELSSDTDLEPVAPDQP